MISACSKVEGSLNRTSMDRAERRQRRLDRKNWGGVIGGKRRDASRGLDQESVDQRASKCADCGSDEKKLSRRGPLGPNTLCNSCGLRWAAKKKSRNAARNLQDTSSEEESVEEIVQERGAGMYIKDLERKLRDLKSEQQKLQNELHVSDANVSTYRKLSDQKQNKIDELETLVESLTTKIGQISSSANGVSSARCVEELRTQVRVLEEKNSKLVENMQLMSELLSKSFSSVKEILAESIQTNDEHRSGSGRSGAVTEQQQQGDVDVDVDVDADADADIGDNELDYVFRRPERMRAAGNAPVHVPNRVKCSGSDTAGKRRGPGWEWGYDGKPVELANDVADDRRRDEVRSFRKDVGEGSGTRQRDKQVGGASGEGKFPLISLDDSLKAREYVEQSFITWVNSTLRKPTAEEMVHHKTSGNKTWYWSGIPGDEILGVYADVFPRKVVPNDDDLDVVFRGILHIDSCALPTGVDWCLVWQQCVELGQLPGSMGLEVLPSVSGVRRRPRCAGIADDEDSDRSLRQRFT